jgi:hypothetical protein
MAYLPRLVDPALERLRAGVAAILLVGPRACGKTTTARRHVQGELRLDRPADAGLVRADPDAALVLHPGPLLVDEWQLEPPVLGAIKRAVDGGAEAGRFLITGSAQTDLSAAGWPLTGRAVRLAMWGLTERELVGDPSAASILARWPEEGVAALGSVAQPPSLDDYVQRALRGGLPEIVLAEPGLRARRLAGYVDEIVAREGVLPNVGRDPARLRRYLQAWAANLACVAEHRTLYVAADINRVTAVAYDALLSALLVIEPLPAWSSNRLERLTGRPKRHLVDPALVGPLLGVDSAGVFRDPTLLGRLLESFTLAQLRPELALLDYPPRMYHLRDQDGRHEVDLIVEYPDGRVVALEVKAGVSASRADARHLIWLRDRLGERFICGVVLHTGPHTHRLDDRIGAAPIAALWE